MRIVQISDLHVGGVFRQESFDILVQEINNEIKPDLIIVSGDLTDEGFIFQYEEAKRQIERLECSEKIVFAGNHDYRHTGYILYEKCFPSSKQIYEYEKGNVVIVVVETAIPDEDVGEVGKRQNIWLNETLKKYNDSKDGKKIKKIVAMHHQLIAVPDTGMTSVVGITDAGNVLRTCLDNGVDLVICGHRHRPWSWQVGDMQLASAGTASSWRFRGLFENSYNIIEIKDNGTIEVDIKIVGGRRMPLQNIVHIS